MSLEGMDNLDDSAFDDNFGDFGDFGDFQSGTSVTADSSRKLDTITPPPPHIETGGDRDSPSDGELTPTAGSWISDLSEGDGDSSGSISSSIDSIRSAGEGEGTRAGPMINTDKVSKEKEKN